ncbi:SubName: Full=Related to WD40-repeat protein (Notchless protein) {ECO:0000313/EMBL:CCA76432.1}; Flags: Fragment [Serendipita indica DSM 11827]|nr:SubName: Full=Related to WD40-repeat protein (Notchless protein) {ECO:0000313/EMBL:CCA76432.1}; Flags: Fragment [Serendipita indica DSM 11827]
MVQDKDPGWIDVWAVKDNQPAWFELLQTLRAHTTAPQGQPDQLGINDVLEDCKESIKRAITSYLTTFKERALMGYVNWDAETSQQIGIPLEGHMDRVFSIVFSPDDHRLASVSGDETV